MGIIIIIGILARLREPSCAAAACGSARMARPPARRPRRTSTLVPHARTAQRSRIVPIRAGVTRLIRIRAVAAAKKQAAIARWRFHRSGAGGVPRRKTTSCQSKLRRLPQ
jgi:hypothetical protein